MTSFEKMCAYMAKRSFYAESDLNRFLALGVDPNEWNPSWPAAKILRFIVQYRKSNSHDYAMWKIKKEPSLEAALQIVLEQAAMEDLSDLDETVRTEYKKLLKEHLTELLSVAVAKNPDKVEELFRAFSERINRDDDCVAMHLVADKYLAEYEEDVKNKQSVIRIPDYPILSDAIGGFNKGRLGLCIAQSGYGKSMLALNLALSAVKRTNVLYINMEMPLKDMFERVSSIITGREFYHLRSHGNIPTDLIKDKLCGPGFESLFMSTGIDLSIEQLCTTARSKNVQYPLGFIIVDYDQKLILPASKNSPEWQELQRAMVYLEGLAKELMCFVLVLGQEGEEGRISGSHRMRFAASNVWRFHEHEEFGPLIELIKVRHSDRVAIRMHYQRATGRIEEKMHVHDAPNPIPISVLKTKKVGPMKI